MIVNKKSKIGFGWWAAIFSVLLLTLPTMPVWAADDAERERTLIIGKVSPNPKKHYKSLKLMADYVVSHMSDLGIDKSAVLLAKDNRQMIRYLQQGKIDWVTETVFSAVEYEAKAESEMFLLKHKKGVPTYHTVFFARDGTEIKNLQDLKGKVITFEDPGSTTAFFIPAAYILDEGLELVQLESPRESAPANAVGYVFAKAEINMSTWVHKGIVDAEAYSNLDWNKEDHTPPSFKKNMYIFYEGDDVPRAIESVRKGLRPEIKQRLKSVLLNAHKDSDATVALKAYQKTTRFDEINDRVEEGIEHAREVMKVVQDKLNL